MKFPAVLMRDALSGRWFAFGRPRRVIAASDHHVIPRLLEEIEGEVREKGLWAAGFLSYEAAPAFDAALSVHLSLADTPLLWFGLFDPPETVETLPWPEPGAFRLGPLQTPLTRESYTQAITRIKDAIARGDVYQINYTFPLFTDFQGDAPAFFLQLQHNQNARFAAYLETDDWVIASASPELFFYREGGRIWMRPMKGTAPRGASAKEDAEQARALAASSKNQAENVMIVDMVRNDLGRIARIGSVQTTDIFRIEPYPTLYQMTSTVQARSNVSFAGLMAAIFPSASITGAPKVSAMHIIRQLEPSQRGVYTGAIGFLTPDGRAQFNVAIRTAVIQRKTGRMRYHVGSGVVWDSEARSEYDECWLKAAVLTRPAPPFQLLESLLWTPEQGLSLLDRHLARLCASAAYFHFPCPADAIRQRLHDLTASLSQASHKVRLLLNRQGVVQMEAAPLQTLNTPQHIALASFPVEPDDPFLRHKTTRRETFDMALQEHPGLDDVMLWNRRGELTESTRANLVLAIDGEMLTPAASSGLLPGTLRAELLARGALREAVLTKTDLHRADAIYLINSVRGWMPAVLTG